MDTFVVNEGSGTKIVQMIVQKKDLWARLHSKDKEIMKLKL